MPKRSNEFQALMAFIYSQMAQPGARVTESALLIERTSGAEREVDILVEQDIAGHTVRLGIECRDRATKDDVTWIDGVIGKYADLDVQKVVVVSRLGFSQTALKKANAHNIDACTLEEANARNWPNECLKLGFGIVTRVDHIASVTLHGEPRPTVGLSLDVTVEKENGEIVGSLKQVIMNCFNTRVSKDITDYLKEHFLSLFKVASDFQKSLEGSVPVSFSEPLVIKVGDIEHKLTRAVFSTRSTFTLEVKPVDRYAYKHAGISICKIGGDERTPTISVVQVPRAKDER